MAASSSCSMSRACCFVESSDGDEEEDMEEKGAVTGAGAGARAGAVVFPLALLRRVMDKDTPGVDPGCARLLSARLRCSERGT